MFKCCVSGAKEDVEESEERSETERSETVEPAIGRWKRWSEEWHGNHIWQRRNWSPSSCKRQKLRWRAKRFIRCLNMFYPCSDVMIAFFKRHSVVPL